MENDAWTGKWLTKKLSENDCVKKSEFIDNNHIYIETTTGECAHVATVSQDPLEFNRLDAILENFPDFDFVVNVKKEALIDGLVLGHCEMKNIGIGELGDLHRAINSDQFRGYLNPEVKFILLGLRQHSAVSHVERLDSKRYMVFRKLNKVVVLSLNEYEVTAVSVREAIGKFKTCDFILASNPYSRITSSAQEVSDALEIPIVKWGELLSILKRL